MINASQPYSNRKPFSSSPIPEPEYNMKMKAMEEQQRYAGAIQGGNEIPKAIPAAMGRLEENISLLDNTLGELFRRIEPLLSGHNKPTSTDRICRPVTDPSLGYHIDLQADRVRELANRVSESMEGLGI